MAVLLRHDVGDVFVRHGVRVKINQRAGVAVGIILDRAAAEVGQLLEAGQGSVSTTPSRGRSGTALSMVKTFSVRSEPSGVSV